MGLRTRFHKLLATAAAAALVGLAFVATPAAATEPATTDIDILTDNGNNDNIVWKGGDCKYPVIRTMVKAPDRIKPSVTFVLNNHDQFVVEATVLSGQTGELQFTPTYGDHYHLKLYAKVGIDGKLVLLGEKEGKLDDCKVKDGIKLTPVCTDKPGDCRFEVKSKHGYAVRVALYNEKTKKWTKPVLIAPNATVIIAVPCKEAGEKVIAFWVPAKDGPKLDGDLTIEWQDDYVLSIKGDEGGHSRHIIGWSKTITEVCSEKATVVVTPCDGATLAAGGKLVVKLTATGGTVTGEVVAENGAKSKVLTKNADGNYEGVVDFIPTKVVAVVTKGTTVTGLVVSGIVCPGLPQTGTNTTLFVGIGIFALLVGGGALFGTSMWRRRRYAAVTAA